MSGPIEHLTSVTPFILGNKWLNSLTLFIAVAMPDIMPVLISPILIFVFDLKGEKFNWFFTFFDQTILGGVITIVFTSISILLFIKYFPKLSKPFKWRQNYSSKAVVFSTIIGVSMHIIVDLFMTA